MANPLVRLLLIGGVVAGGAFVMAHRPSPDADSVKQAPKAETPKAKPLPPLVKPKAIAVPEKKQSAKKKQAKPKAKSSSSATCPYKNTGAVLECPEMSYWRDKVKRLPPAQRAACERTATMAQKAKGLLCGITS